MPNRADEFIARGVKLQHGQCIEFIVIIIFEQTARHTAGQRRIIMSEGTSKVCRLHHSTNSALEVKFEYHLAALIVCNARTRRPFCLRDSGRWTRHRCCRPQGRTRIRNDLILQNTIVEGRNIRHLHTTRISNDLILQNTIVEGRNIRHLHGLFQLRIHSVMKFAIKRLRQGLERQLVREGHGCHRLLTCPIHVAVANCCGEQLLEHIIRHDIGCRNIFGPS